MVLKTTLFIFPHKLTVALAKWRVTCMQDFSVFFYGTLLRLCVKFKFKPVVNYKICVTTPCHFTLNPFYTFFFIKSRRFCVNCKKFVFLGEKCAKKTILLFEKGLCDYDCGHVLTESFLFRKMKNCFKSDIKKRAIFVTLK